MLLQTIKVILRPGDNTSLRLAGKNEETYTAVLVLMKRNSLPWKQCIYTFSALVTDQIRDAITAEAVSALC
jgi:hypothetical protein